MAVLSAKPRWARATLTGAALLAALAGCGEDVQVGADRPMLGGSGSAANTEPGAGGGAATNGGSDASVTEDANADAGVGLNDAAACEPRTCQGSLSQCADCDDNDQDGLIDEADPDCLSPCQNAEDTFFVAVQNVERCTQDCYFDDNAGFGNDECVWGHFCDPLSVTPAFSPNGAGCAYAPDEPLQGPTMTTCAGALASQTSACLGSCLPLTPPGCDCFGCCAFPDAPTPVWIGSHDEGEPTCSRAAVADETRCRPCTQVTSCLNSGREPLRASAGRPAFADAPSRDTVF